MLENAKFVLSKTIVLEKFREMADLAAEVSYSLKTNYEVGQILEEQTGCQFSVHSIPAIKKLKVPSRAWFFAQALEIDELDELFQLRCNSFVVDNQADLNVLLKYVQDTNKKINLLLRMRLKEHTVHAGKHFVFGFFSSKINKLIPELRKKNSINKLGIHFHRKTQNVSEWSLKEELEQVLVQETLDDLDYVNIGGGIPSVYKNFRAEVLQNIFTKISELKYWLESINVKMIIEPGRYIAAPSVKLVAKIKNIYDNNIIINCSVFNSAMDTFVAHIRLLIEGELEKGDYFLVKGCTPDSMDIFRYRVFLDNPKIGDEIIFLNAGAYNFSTEFCQLPKLETVVVEKFPEFCQKDI